VIFAAALRPEVKKRERVGMALLLGAIAGMLLAWEWEFPAALISLFALEAFAAVVHINRYDVLAVAAIPNVLFLLDWTLRHSTPNSKPRRTKGYAGAACSPITYPRRSLREYRTTTYH